MVFIARAFLAFSLVLGLSEHICAAETESSAGVVKLVSGDVQIKKNHGSQFVKLKPQSEVAPGDVLMTGQGSYLKLAMKDDNVIVLTENTVLKFVRYEYDPSRFEKNVELKLEFGQVRSVVKQRYDGQKSRYLVHTPSGLAEVHGTDFVTSYNVASNQTEVMTLEGGVNFASRDSKGQLGESKLIVAGHVSNSSMTKSASEPRVATSDKLKIWREMNVSRDTASLVVEPATPATDAIAAAAQDSASSGILDHSPISLPSEDLATCNNCEIAPVGDTLSLPGFSTERAVTPDVSTCEFCERVIQDGNTTVNIFLVPTGP